MILQLRIYITLFFRSIAERNKQCKTRRPRPGLATFARWRYSTVLRGIFWSYDAYVVDFRSISLQIYSPFYSNYGAILYH